MDHKLKKALRKAAEAAEKAGINLLLVALDPKPEEAGVPVDGVLAFNVIDPKPIAANLLHMAGNYPPVGEVFDAIIELTAPPPDQEQPTGKILTPDFTFSRKK